MVQMYHVGARFEANDEGILMVPSVLSCIFLPSKTCDRCPSLNSDSHGLPGLQPHAYYAVQFPTFISTIVPIARLGW